MIAKILSSQTNSAIGVSFLTCEWEALDFQISDASLGIGIAITSIKLRWWEHTEVYTPIWLAIYTPIWLAIYTPIWLAIYPPAVVAGGDVFKSCYPLRCRCRRRRSNDTNRPNPADHICQGPDHPTHPCRLTFSLPPMSLGQFYIESQCKCDIQGEVTPHQRPALSLLYKEIANWMTLRTPSPLPNWRIPTPPPPRLPRVNAHGPSSLQSCSDTRDGCFLPRRRLPISPNLMVTRGKSKSRSPHDAWYALDGWRAVLCPKPSKNISVRYYHVHWR